MNLTRVVPIALIVAVTNADLPVKAQNSYPYNSRSLAECYRNAPTGGYFDDLARGVCDLYQMLEETNQVAPRNYSVPSNVYQDGVDYITLGRDIRTSYESPTAYVWADGARGFISGEGDIYRITKQRADDGNIIYYLRVNSAPRIYRYNASRNSTGYTDVWSYSTGSGYLKCRVTMLTDDGRYLDSSQVTDVETNDMYPAIRALLAFQ